jgi:hypothetical protein
LAPALACPGVTEVLPDAEPAAEVCVVALVAARPTTIAAIQNIFMFKYFPLLVLKFENPWGLELAKLKNQASKTSLENRVAKNMFPFTI